MTNLNFNLTLLLWLLPLASAFGTNCCINAVPTTVKSSRLTPMNVPAFWSSNCVGSSTTQLVTSLRGGYDSDANVISSFAKTPEENMFLKEALLRNVMFAKTPKSTLDSLIDNFEKIIVHTDDVIMTQGEMDDESNYVYLVGDGECTVSIDGKYLPEPYGTLKPRAIFGELAIMYNKPRSATVKAKSETVSLFRLKSDIFKSILSKQGLLPKSNDDLKQLEQIDKAINLVAGTKTLYGGDIIRKYEPNRLWLWTRWKGTVLQNDSKIVVGNMLVSLAFIIFSRHVTNCSWELGMTPDGNHPYIKRLEVIRHLWNYLMTLTTFILAFFLNQAWDFWNDVVGVVRKIQGGLSNFNLMVATSTKRNSKDNTYTLESQKLIDDIGAISRLFHALFWASSARRFAVLNTPQGMECMASRGLMTSRQLQVLQSLDLPANQRHHACIEWMMIRVWQGIDDKLLRGDCSKILMDEMCELRGAYESIKSKISCRMPLPYTHMVQVLVDCFIVLCPVALYPDLGAFSVFGVGILTFFYTGLLDIAKIFLDPLANDDLTVDSLSMDLAVLIRQSNAGSTRWKNAGASLPF